MDAIDLTFLDLSYDGLFSALGIECPDEEAEDRLPSARAAHHDHDYFLRLGLDDEAKTTDADRPEPIRHTMDKQMTLRATPASGRISLGIPNGLDKSTEGCWRRLGRLFPSGADAGRLRFAC